MKEDYVSFEISKLLKEKGFDGEWTDIYVENPDSTNRAIYPKITLQMAMKYLREVHNLFIEIHFYQDTYEDVCCEVGWKEPTYNYRIIGIGNNDADHVDIDFNSYESACEAAIKYCLTNLI